ncbi:23S rRNA (guanosine(2251)-2'-O)-methyltransferase RlmB [Desulfuromonas sp. AOP6]|uniref:23S rRNA (guanosine(2251)-2'-O)-methyltransferase RlmB n=1 Tax=Desulfuromonas sp. AOP6 TaxID=1566351 RepID=UPI001289BD38|nr:23S rRNA (guanosine(2251)-2'-O)-methyltransferase RlmB [Desulfuromonas sp. AOP6]BCA80480.1 23S rRNA (guanosine (2251)-2'-O)-methyltransferase RlmB [Desulfuromonas sp. AOP6]
MADWIYGVNPAREGLRSRLRRPLELVVVSQSPSARLQEVIDEASRAGVTIRQVDRKEMDRLAGNNRHQGVLLKVEDFSFASLDDLVENWRASGKPAFFLLLDGITDPHNLGALIRSAEGAGCHGVIIPKDRACGVTGVVDKSSAGALEHIPLCQVTNLARTMDELRREGVWVYGLAGDADSQDIYSCDLVGNVALVVGSEGSGLRPNVKAHCDGLLRIPMAGTVSSLNASVAGALAMYEVVRQRKNQVD